MHLFKIHLINIWNVEYVPLNLHCIWIGLELHWNAGVHCIGFMHQNQTNRHHIRCNSSVLLYEKYLNNVRYSEIHIIYNKYNYTNTMLNYTYGKNIFNKI